MSDIEILKREQNGLFDILDFFVFGAMEMECIWNGSIRFSVCYSLNSFPAKTFKLSLYSVQCIIQVILI